jgi:hypothetical protein
MTVSTLMRWVGDTKYSLARMHTGDLFDMGR